LTRSSGTTPFLFIARRVRSSVNFGGAVHVDGSNSTIPESSIFTGTGAGSGGGGGGGCFDFGGDIPELFESFFQ
jgi:hypothetical protein